MQLSNTAHEELDPQRLLAVLTAMRRGDFSVRMPDDRTGLAGKIADGANEHDVYTRFDSPARAKQLTPRGCVFVGARGVRITIPTAKVMKPRLGRRLFRAAEHALCDSPLNRLAGFYVAAYEKRENLP